MAVWFSHFLLLSGLILRFNRTGGGQDAMGLRWRALITIAIAAVLGGLVYCFPWVSLGRHLPWPQSTSLGQRMASWQQATSRTQECVTCNVELRVMTKGLAVMQTPAMMKTEAVTTKKTFTPAVDSVGPTLKR